MQLWLVCFLILFFGAEAAQWLGQLPWLSPTGLSLPVAIAGGIGLAIASNARLWRPRNGPSSAAKPEVPAGPTPAPAKPPIPSPPRPVPRPQASTISFEIKPASKKTQP